MECMVLLPSALLLHLCLLLLVRVSVLRCDLAANGSAVLLLLFPPMLARLLPHRSIIFRYDSTRDITLAILPQRQRTTRNTPCSIICHIRCNCYGIVRWMCNSCGPRQMPTAWGDAAYPRTPAWKPQRHRMQPDVSLCASAALSRVT